MINSDLSTRAREIIGHMTEREAMREYAACMDRQRAERFAFFEVKRAMEGKQ